MRPTVLFLILLLLAVPVQVVHAAGGGDITFELQKADPVIFSHDHHLKARGLKCAACHFNKFSKGVGYEMKKEAITKRDFCGSCHNGLKAFDVEGTNNCKRCHRK